MYMQMYLQDAEQRCSISIHGYGRLAAPTAPRAEERRPGAESVPAVSTNTLQGTLFDALDLLIEWGRLGQVPKVRVERFKDAGRLEARWRELVGRRRRHGYADVGVHSEETNGHSRPTRETWTAPPAAGGLT